ncbi:MAG: amino acid adenylation domain-containing protein [Cyclobacteriaceae bacterium]
MSNQNAIHLTGTRYDGHRKYWKEKIAGNTTFFFVQDTHTPISAEPGFVSKSYTLPAEPLADLAGGNPMAVWVILSGTVGILLRKYARSNEVIIESPLLQKNLDSSVQNPFVALNLSVNGSQSSRAYLNELKAEFKQAYTYQNYPYKLADDTAPDVLSNVLVSHSSLHLEPDDTVHDLHLQFSTGQGLTCRITYRKNKFDKAFIDRLTGHLEMVLDSFQNLEKEVKSLQLLPQHEIEQLAAYQPERFQKEMSLTLHGAFSAMANRQPESIALKFEGGQMTYAELNRKSNAYGFYLQEKFGVEKGDIVALLLERSEYMIITMLAVMKAGATYLPLNPNDPTKRLSGIMDDSGSNMLVTQMDFFNNNLFYQGNVSAVDVELETVPVDAKPDQQVGEDDIAYVIYTSGSTGKPKGVAVKHKGVTSMAVYSGGMFELSPADTMLQFASYTFDASVFEIYSALLNGSSLYLITGEYIKNSHLIEDLLESGRITVFSTTPSYLKLLDTDKMSRLRAILTAGEEALPETISKLPSNVRYLNGYGPTECSVAICFFEVKERLPYRKIPLGAPRPGLKAYIIDQDQQLAFSGIPGELYISGIGLSAGYINSPKENNQRFVYLSDIAGDERLYRTGDICQWDEEGHLIFVGRDDEQYKIRGLRIETGEISHALRSHPDITDAAVAVIGTKAREYLAAYYVSTREIGNGELTSHMDSRLPDYMVPVHYSKLDTIPLTTGGKLDKKALPDPVAMKSVAYAAPVTPAEHTVADIWQNEFTLEKIGTEDNFFRLGGNSLKAISILNQLQEAFAVEVSFDDLFSNPTISELARFIDQNDQGVQAERIPPALDKTYYQVPFQQAGMWVRYEFQEVGRIPYNSGSVSEWPQLDIHLLEEALLAVINRHEILRSSFHTVDNVATQKVHTAEDAMPEIEFHDLSGNPDENERTEKIIYDGHQSMFKLEMPGLIRVIVIKNKESGFILQVVIPHFIVDGWSRGIFERDLQAAYEALQADKEVTLQPLPVQSKDYAEWYYDLLDSGKGTMLKEYWTDKLTDAPLFQLRHHYRTDQLPVLIHSHREKLKGEMEANFYSMNREEKERAFSHIASAQTYEGAGYAHHVGNEIHQGIRRLAEQSESGTFTILLAGLGRCIQHLSENRDVVIGSVAALRNHPDLQDLIGSFTNIILYRLQPKEHVTDSTYIQSVNEEVRQADAHKLYPFEFMLNDTDYSMDSLGELWLNFDSQDRPMGEAANEHSRDHRDKAYPYFNLNLTFTEYSDGITMDITYKTDYFTSEFIEQLLDKYIIELKKIVSIV